MRLVDDQGIVLFKPGVTLRLGEQDAVGHQLDEGVWRSAIAETNLVADERAELALQLLCDTRCGGARSDAAWLRVTDQTGRSASNVETDLRDLRGFA
jgi:hypothetical protein